MRSDEIRLIRVSSSLVVAGDDDRDEEKGPVRGQIFVGVSKSMSTGFDGGDAKSDVDDGKSDVEPSPAAESAKLLA